MPRKKQSLTFAQQMLRLSQSGIRSNKTKNGNNAVSMNDTLEERVKNIVNIITRPHGKQRMIYFIMYDIEDNRVRTQISKYLLRHGCTRIQKSIFLADTTPATHNQIRNDLAEVQACYDNHDSVIICPISTDEIHAMSVIGKSVDVDMILHSRTTLIF